jgi:hypothetical protein
MTMHTRVIAIATIVGTVGAVGAARADSSARPSDDDSGAHLVGDVRAMMLVRDDNNYFRHASAWGYSVPNEAGGIQLALGGAIGRLSFAAEGFYVGDGADRGDARLRIESGALLGVASYALARFAEKRNAGAFVLRAGFGRYVLHESFVDRNLSPMVYKQDDASFGGFAGVEANLTLGAFRAMIAYGYHVAPAQIADRVRGSVTAGGHEVSIGLGVRL